KARPPDLDAVELTLAGVGDGGDPAGELALLRGLASLGVPALEAVEAAATELAEAASASAALAGTDAARAASAADLLHAALEHDAAHHGADCPVCGAADRMDETWRTRARAEGAR